MSYYKIVHWLYKNNFKQLVHVECPTRVYTFFKSTINLTLNCCRQTAQPPCHEAAMSWIICQSAALKNLPGCFTGLSQVSQMSHGGTADADRLLWEVTGNMQATTASAEHTLFPPSSPLVSTRGPLTCVEPNVGSRTALQSSETCPAPIWPPEGRRWCQFMAQVRVTRNNVKIEHGYYLLLCIIDLPKNASTDLVCACVFCASVFSTFCTQVKNR